MNPEETEQADDEARRRPPIPPADEQPMLFCPVCSERLAQNRCKLVCQKCGYFMSCADYY